MKAHFRSALLLMATIVLSGSSHAVRAQAPTAFGDLFADRALRLECTFTGNAKEQSVTVDRLIGEALWPESTTHLLDPYPNGRYLLEVVDGATNRVVYSRGFDAMIGEYVTTDPALAGTAKSLSRSLRIPFPRGPVVIVLSRRDRDNIPHPLLVRRFDPATEAVVQDVPSPEDEVIELAKAGDPHQRVDLVFLSEGYAKGERAKFEADLKRVSSWLFEVEPYKGARELFNLRGVFRPSPESGVSQPKSGVQKRTALGASFDAFGVERYLLTEQNTTLRQMAARVPYDAAVILVNSDRYGGGGIYNDYCITTVDNARSRMVFVHEFGHAFAGLADEYYLAEVAYNDAYPKGVEPLEPNVTECLDPTRLKWRDLLSPGIPIPTPWGKEEMDQIQGEVDKTRVAERQALAEAKAAKASSSKLETIHKKYAKEFDALKAKQAEVRKRFPALEDKVGLFEGAAYTSQGMYRSQMFCLMGNTPKEEFCKVCQRAIGRAIAFQAGP
jgi:hypothetical protein